MQLTGSLLQGLLPEKQTVKHLQGWYLVGVHGQTRPMIKKFGPGLVVASLQVERGEQISLHAHRVCVLLYPVATHASVAVLPSNWTHWVFGGAVDKIPTICGTPEWSHTLGNVIRSLRQQLGERPVGSEIPILGELSLWGFTTDLEVLADSSLSLTPVVMAQVYHGEAYGVTWSRLQVWKRRHWCTHIINRSFFNM